MQLEEFVRDEAYAVARHEHGDDAVLAVDFGPTDGVAEVVGDTVIVVVGDGQYDIDLPEAAEAAGVFMKNGVLTIELEADE